MDALIFVFLKMQNEDRFAIPNELTTLKSSMQKIDAQRLERKKRKGEWIQVKIARYCSLYAL